MMIIGNIIATIATSAVASASFTALWSMINCLQIIHFMPIMTLYLPSNVRSMFKVIALVNLQNQPLANVYMKHFDASKIKEDFPPDY